MDFFYYNNKNEQVRLNIEIGVKWSDLNIQNNKINSIFAKVDNGDGIVSKDEFSLLDTIFKKADGILNPKLKNNVLENDELEEVIKELDTKNINDKRISLENIPHTPRFSKKDVVDLNDPQKVDAVHEKQITKIKESLRKYHHYDERFPESQYDIEIIYDGTNYESNVYKRTPNKTSHFMNKSGIIKEDDFTEKELEKLDDNFLNMLDINRPQGREWTPELSKIFASILYNEIPDEKTIKLSIDRWGGKRNIVYDFDTKTLKFADGDENEYETFTMYKYSKKGNVIEEKVCLALDTYEHNDKKQEIGSSFVTWLASQEGFSRKENEKISDEQLSLYKELYNNEKVWAFLYKHDKTEGLNFSDEPYLKKDIDTNEIQEESLDNSEYEGEYLVVKDVVEHENFSFVREDGINIEIKDKNSYSSKINITTPNGKVFSIDCEGYAYGDDYIKNQFPVLKNVLNKLPVKVLEDISNEISDIKLNNGMSSIATYSPNTNTLECNTKYKNIIPMSLVHEIGHAIDNHNGNMWSKNAKFTAKFKRFKELADKLIKHDFNHALDLPEEYFASSYANFEFSNGFNNHIESLNKMILPFENSSNSEEKELYNLHVSLQNDLKSRIEEVRSLPQRIRMDNNEFINIVKTELKDIIDGLNKHKASVAAALGIFQERSLELSIIENLVSDDKQFKNAIKIYEECANNERISPYDTKLKVPVEAQELFKLLVTKLKEIKARRIKN